MKDICKQNYPDIPYGSSTDFYQNCALSLVLHKANMQVVEHCDIPSPVFMDVSNLDFSKAIKIAHDGSCFLMLIMAIGSYYMGINLDQDCMLMMIFLINM
jgi:hypothetical protein